MATKRVHRYPNAVLLLAACLGIGATQAADIHRCTSADGSLAFQDTPCPADQRAERVVLPPPPSAQPSPDYAIDPARTNARRPRAARAPRVAEPDAYECTTANGVRFFRLSACPVSIPRGDGGPAARRAATRAEERVRARRVPIREACRALRLPGRSGREHDETISTYERNLGRDPCRRY